MRRYPPEDAHGAGLYYYLVIIRKFRLLISIPSPSVISVLLNHNTVTNDDQILQLKCHSFLIGNTHRSNARSSDSWSGWFVWNQLPRADMAAY